MAEPGVPGSDSRFSGWWLWHLHQGSVDMGTAQISKQVNTSVFTIGGKAVMLGYQSRMRGGCMEFSSFIIEFDGGEKIDWAIRSMHYMV
jgi:hypothetical protein